MSHNAIRNKFEEIVSTWAATVPIRVSYENVAFTPVADEHFIVSELSPVITRSRTLTGTDHTEYQGIYQLSVVINEDESVGYANTLAEGIKTLFPIYQPIKVGTGPSSFTVSPITPVSVMDGLPGNSKYTLPIRFTYRADV